MAAYHQLSDLLFSFKEKLTDAEFKASMDLMKKMFEDKHTEEVKELKRQIEKENATKKYWLEEMEKRPMGRNPEEEYEEDDEPEDPNAIPFIMMCWLNTDVD